MLYNCYIKNNMFIMDIANSHGEIETINKPFQFVLGEKTEINSKIKDIFNNNINLIKFQNYFSFLKFKKENKHKELYGLIDPVYYAISKFLPEKIPVYNPDFYVFDIETYSEVMPDANVAPDKINLITLLHYKTKKIYTFGLKDYSNKNNYDVEYVKCHNEQNLLESFIILLKHNNIKCLTGWNIDDFDIPYIINRMKKFSFNSTIIRQFIEENIFRDKIFSIVCIDYMLLYKKFKPIKLERYKLDFVANYEIGKGKLSMPYSFTEAFDSYYEEFVDYNIVDNIVIAEIEDKIKYIKQCFHMVNTMKCLPNDVFSPVKMWDGLFYDILRRKNIMVQPVKNEEKIKLLGGYVGNPIIGNHKNVSVFDIASSYPHQIMQFNIGYETLILEQNLPIELIELRKQLTPNWKDMLSLNDIQYNETIHEELNDMLKSLTETVTVNNKKVTVINIPEAESWNILKDILKVSKKTKSFELIEYIQHIPIEFIEKYISKSSLNHLRLVYNIIRFSRYNNNDFNFITELLKKYNVTMTPNLQFYDKTKKSLFSVEVEKAFAERNIAKKLDGGMKLHIGIIEKILKNDSNKIIEKENIDIIEHDFFADLEIEDEDEDEENIIEGEDINEID